MFKNHISLLPNGLSDLLAPQAQSEADAITTFMTVFSLFGYQRVKPPLVEFEESLLGEGPGQRLARQTFRMMDPVSGRMMGVRADVTAQIARIAGTRLADEPRPLRLSYAADVLRVNGTQLRPERQFCQVGCEMIGRDTVTADVEAPLIALNALSRLGVQELSVDLTVPTLIHYLYEETGTDDDKRAVLDDAIEKRDMNAVLGVGGEVSKQIAALVKGSGLDLTPRARNDYERLLAVAKELREALDIYGLRNVAVTIDPLERRGFEYQTGVSFTLFSKGARGELGRGGRYEIASETPAAAPETATGFTLYMDSILRVAPSQTHKIPSAPQSGATWEDVKALQDKDFSAFRD